MNLLITFEQYKQNGGIVLPGEPNDYDKSNGINSEEEKFNKWLEYTQIQLNYVLQDSLEPKGYNLLQVKEAYRRDIINILVIRLNRAFENERIIPRNETVSYSESGGINWNSMAEIHGQGWSFWNEQELNILEVSGLLAVVNNLYIETGSSGYPTTLTDDMANRLINDDTININKKVNPNNGLTSLEFAVTDKIARKSEIPNIADLKNKVENNSKNIVNLETTKQKQLSKEQIDNINNIVQKFDIKNLIANGNIEIKVDPNNSNRFLIRSFDPCYDDDNGNGQKCIKNISLFRSDEPRVGPSSSDLVANTAGETARWYATKQQVNKKQNELTNEDLGINGFINKIITKKTNYPDLKASDKTLIGAINEALNKTGGASGGRWIKVGTRINNYKINYKFKKNYEYKVVYEMGNKIGSDGGINLFFNFDFVNFDSLYKGFQLFQVMLCLTCNYERLIVNNEAIFMYGWNEKNEYKPRFVIKQLFEWQPTI